MRVRSLRDIEWLSVVQAGQLVNMSPSKIRRAISDNKLRAFRDGKLFRINREDLDDYMRRGRDGKLETN